LRIFICMNSYFFRFPSHYWGVGIISFPFSRREIDGYKVPSKLHYRFSQRLFVGVLNEEGSWWHQQRCRLLKKV
jgi:hypothetical protein